MQNISKIIVLFIALVISYINSGLLRSVKIQDSVSFTEESYPATDRFSTWNILLFPISDIIVKNNLVPGKPVKPTQKIKIPWAIRSGTLVIKNHLYPLGSEVDDPVLFTDIFSASDISFPFNFFW